MNFRLIVSFIVCCASISALSPFISSTRDGVDYTKTVTAQDELYLVMPNSSNNGLSRVAVVRSADGSSVISFVDMVPEKTRINGVLSDNPLYEQKIHALASYQNFPLVSYGSSSSAVHSVALVNDNARGSAVLVNTQSFGDALGAATRNIVQIAAGTPSHFAQGLVFAAVSPSDDAACAGQSGAGVGVAQITSGGIVPFDVRGTNSGPRAAPLTDELISVNSEGSINRVTGMCWNPVLNKLFVALDVSRGVALVVGSLDIPSTSKITGKVVPGICFSLKPCIVGDSGVNSGDWNDQDFIVADADNAIALQTINIMNASTGFSYAVVSRDNHKVYAVPLISDAKNSAAGMLAKKNDCTQVATVGNTTQLLSIDDAAALVGGQEAPAEITSVAVYGDSVFISCAGSTHITAGVFASQALFDINGTVRGWSKWESILCSSQPVYGFCRDIGGRIKYLTTVDAQDTDKNTVCSTAWGSGHNNGWWGGTGDNRRIGLIDQLNNFFSVESGGVQSLVSFSSQLSDQRWGHTSTKIFDGNSLLVFTGRNKCAVALTVKNDELVGKDQFIDSDYYREYDLSPLDLGAITTATVSRGDDGWLFVGGSNGIAVLSKTGGGGWGILNDLNDLEGMRFHTITKENGIPFSQVRQLLTDESALYVICAEGVYRAEYDSDAFKASNPPHLVAELIATPEQLCGSVNETIISGLLEGDFLFLATSRGLRVNNVVLSAVQNNTGEHGWGLVTLTPGGTDSFGVCAQLSFVPGVSTEVGGTLIVLTADVALNVATVYRINIPNAELGGFIVDDLGAVVHTVEAPCFHASLLGQFREYFYIDGGLMIDASSMHHQFGADGNGVVRILPVSRRIGAIDAWSEAVQPVLDESVTINTIAGIVRDPATGTIIIPGLWGIQVLQ
jgi:hypothetical protein